MKWWWALIAMLLGVAIWWMGPWLAFQARVRAPLSDEERAVLAGCGDIGPVLTARIWYHDADVPCDPDWWRTSGRHVGPVLQRSLREELTASAPATRRTLRAAWWMASHDRPVSSSAWWRIWNAQLQGPLMDLINEQAVLEGAPWVHPLWQADVVGIGWRLGLVEMEDEVGFLGRMGEGFIPLNVPLLEYLSEELSSNAALMAYSEPWSMGTRIVRVAPLKRQDEIIEACQVAADPRCAMAMSAWYETLEDETPPPPLPLVGDDGRWMAASHGGGTKEEEWAIDQLAAWETYFDDLPRLEDRRDALSALIEGRGWGHWAALWGLKERGPCGQAYLLHQAGEVSGVPIQWRSGKDGEYVKVSDQLQVEIACTGSNGGPPSVSDVATETARVMETRDGAKARRMRALVNAGKL